MSSNEPLPLVSIITVNYNEAGVTCELLASIEQLAYANYEVIVVDNGSKQNPEQAIKSQYPDTVFIASKKNLGFAGGNNLGIAAAKGDYLFFVNNDTELKPDVLTVLVQRFKSLPQAGLICPKINFYEPPNLIQYVGSTPINPYTARNGTIGYLEEDKGQYQQLTETPYAHGAAMMVSREVINKVGKMPENFFLYYEELDWCEQMKRAGFKLYVDPSTSIYHKESYTIGRLSTLKTYYLTRNRILFMRRNATRFQLAIFTLFLTFITIPKNVLMYLLRLEISHIKAFLKGVCWNCSKEGKLALKQSVWK